MAPVPVFTWAGFYAGVNAGAAWNDSDLTLSSETPAFFGAIDVDGISSDDAVFTGGAQIGFNYQFGAAVVGVEADINYIDFDDAFSALDVATGDELTVSQEVRWFGTLRARLGFTPAERLLVYATGGLAFGEVESATTFDIPTELASFAGSNSDTRWGWTLGAGAEYAITNNLTVKAEYLYVDLGSESYTAVDPANPAFDYTVEDETNFHVLRAGLNFKFNTF
nr:porin family protein [Microvirga pakistanensis]